MTKVTDWDILDYLKTEEEIVSYLSTVLELGDIDDITQALENIARARGITDTAKASGLSRGTLYKAIGQGANPTLSTFLAVLNAMNISLTAKPKITSTIETDTAHELSTENALRLA